VNRTRIAAMLAACALAALGGCEKLARNMYDQPRDKPLAASPLWSDGRSAREAPPGTVARSAGTSAGTSSGRLGAIAGASATLVPRSEWTATFVARGRERFDIFCAPCHSVAGDGDGMVARRGFPHPPSFHTDRLRDADDAHFYAVISDGYGAMYAYASRIPAADRRAIVAYIRALQLAEHAPIDALPEAARATLEAAR
jgi:Cytochrome C oxidase, cbb3-type, subunit III